MLDQYFLNVTISILRRGRSMISMNSLKKIFFVFLMSVSCPQILSAKGLYVIPDALGDITDYFLSRGDLSEKYTKLFHEIAQKLNIDDREIKVKNAGFLFRFFLGYSNALAMQQTNRVYLNEDYLKQLSDEQIAFLMAHELSHHSKHHVVKTILANIVLGAAQAKTTLLLNSEIFEKSKMNPLLIYVTSGFGSLSIWGLLNAQMAQMQETEADTAALLEAGMQAQAGAELFKELYYPQNMENWPWYGRLQAFFQKLMLPVLNLPFIKQHMAHLVCQEERSAHLFSVEKSE